MTSPPPRDAGAHMKIAVIGASGKTGTALVRESLRRGWDVAAVCRDGSEGKLGDFAGREELEVLTASVASDKPVLTRALAGCDAVVAILISVRRLKATDLVKSLAGAASLNGVKRFVFTSGEITAVKDVGESYTLRQRLMLAAFTPLMALTPYSLADMRKASLLVKAQPDWDWTIVRAPTLSDAPPAGYRLCEISDVKASDSLTRGDYAACLLDSLGTTEHHGRMLTVVGTP